MRVRGGDNSAPFTTFLIVGPAHVVGPVADLQGALIVMPGADVPNGGAVGQLLPDVEILIRVGLGIQEQDAQPSVGAGGFEAELWTRANDSVGEGRGRISVVAINARLELGLVSRGTSPGSFVLVSPDGEIGKLG